MTARPFFCERATMCVNLLYIACLLLGEGVDLCRPYLFFFFYTKKKGILRSLLPMVPLFDGDERVEMQVMLYDFASFTCERQNALLII